MAFNSRRINPLDLQPRKAIGVSLPFSGKAVFNPTYVTKDAIKNNLINYFLTVGKYSVNAQPDLNTVTLLLRYAIQNTNIEDEVVINFEQ